jgi:F-type H+-transporting ATPase subunit b
MPLLLAADSPLLKPNPGLMIWTLIVFFLAMWILKRKAFGPIQEALDKRRQTILESVEQAERTKEEARQLLDEYKQQLAAARGEAEQIVARARKSGDELVDRVKRESDVQRQEQIAATQKQVHAEVEKAMGQLRTELADMTLTATEKVVRGALDAGSQTALIEQAIDELDMDRLQKVGASS